MVGLKKWIEDHHTKTDDKVNGATYHVFALGGPTLSGTKEMFEYTIDIPIGPVILEVSLANSPRILF